MTQTDPADALGAILDSSLKGMREANRDQLVALDQIEAVLRRPKTTKGEMRQVAEACIAVARQTLESVEQLIQSVEQSREISAATDAAAEAVQQLVRQAEAELQTSHTAMSRMMGTDGKAN